MPAVPATKFCATGFSVCHADSSTEAADSSRLGAIAARPPRMFVCPQVFWFSAVFAAVISVNACCTCVPGVIVVGMNWPWLTTGIDADDGAADVSGAAAWVSTVAAVELTAVFCELLTVLLTAVAAEAVVADPEFFVDFLAADAGLALEVECAAPRLACAELEFWLCEDPLLPALELSSA